MAKKEEKITPTTTDDWLSLKNKHNIESENASEALERASVKISNILKETIDSVGGAAIDADKFVKDLIAKITSK